jgi:hypothetical protein
MSTIGLEFTISEFVVVGDELEDFLVSVLGLAQAKTKPKTTPIAIKPDITEE